MSDTESPPNSFNRKRSRENHKESIDEFEQALITVESGKELAKHARKIMNRLVKLDDDRLYVELCKLKVMKQFEECREEMIASNTDVQIVSKSAVKKEEKDYEIANLTK